MGGDDIQKEGDLAVCGEPGLGAAYGIGAVGGPADVGASFVQFGGAKWFARFPGEAKKDQRPLMPTLGLVVPPTSE